MSTNSELTVRRLCNILNLLAPVFNERELEVVRNYIDLSAYDMALEAIVDIIEDKQKDPPDKIYRSIYDLAKIMSFEKLNYAEGF